MVTSSLSQQKRVGIFGGSVCDLEIYKKASEIGRLLAKNDVLIYCGGRGGVMEAVSKGASEDNGMVVGILPDSDCNSANSYITIPIATGAGDARNYMIANSIQGAIAIDGEYGTLTEIGHTLKQGKPVVGLETWGIKGVDVVKSPEEAVSRIMELI